MTVYLALALIVGVAQTNAPTSKGTVEHITVHGKSLEGNLEGDSPDRDVFVYLPRSYATNRNQRFPAVYLLHGYGLTAERWMTFSNLAENADKDIAAGTMKEMILVSPDAFTKYNGSMGGYGTIRIGMKRPDVFSSLYIMSA